MAPRTSSTPTRIIALVAPPVLMMALIFALSGQPSDHVDRAWWDVALRKLAHVTEYAVLTFLWWRALRGLGAGRPLLAAIAVSFGYACTDEFHQTFVDGRRGTPVDVLIDSIGIAIAALAIRASGRPTVAGTHPASRRKAGSETGAREGARPQLR